MSEPLAGLYLHVPFCARVCPYCDFAVRTGDRARRRRFVDSLLAEIELHAGHPLVFDTVYFGGGTPSSLEPADLARIVAAARSRLRLVEDTRIFLEANPEDVTAANARAWAELGVATLSLGIQALDPAGLAFLGRAHGVEDARRAVAVAGQAGFRTLSIDLIYGRPGQTPAAWSDELELALELRADHLSCYQLTIHERTRFGLLEKRGGLTPLSADEQAELLLETHRRLNAAGMQGYEVSQFAARPAHRSRHNTKYWNHTPYLGLGPSAHSFHEGQRSWNIRRTEAWQECVAAGRRPVEGSEALGPEALVLEALMTGLRTYAGVDFDRIEARWGLDALGPNRRLVERLESQGLARLAHGRLVPTLAGLALADSIAATFRLPGDRPVASHRAQGI